jgi:adenine-specific DNA-methyltransferase
MSDRRNATRVKERTPAANPKPPAAEPLPPHPLSQRLPAMNNEEYEALKANVLALGRFTDPAVKFRGFMLDGNNRQRVSIDTGIPLPIVEFEGTELEAEAFVLSKAIRRNLSESQKACAAVHFLPLFENDALSRMKSGGSAPVRQGADEHPHLKWLGKSTVQAGRMFGVGARSVEMAKSLQKQAPEMFEKVSKGEEVLSRAVRIIKRQQVTREKENKLKLIKKNGGVDAAVFLRGDALAEMQKLVGRRFRIIFFDPPYNLGFPYDADPDHDDLPEHTYLHRMAECFKEFRRLLTPDGAVFVMISEEHVEDFGVLLKKAGFHKRRLIVWHESFGEAGSKNFGRTCRFIWYFVMNRDNFVFDETALLTTSKRQSVYGDKRAMPGGKILDALWDFSRLCGTFKERVPDDDVPTQLPRELLKRIIAGFSDPGDEVLDPMCGSGSTAIACAELHRRATCIDRSSKYIRIAKRELALATEGT